VFLEVANEPIAGGELAVGFGQVEEAIGVDVLVGVAPFELDELVAGVFADVLWTVEEIGRLGAEIVLGVDEAEPLWFLLVAADEEDASAEIGEGDGAEEAFDGA
jgi:hypothetical protein